MDYCLHLKKCLLFHPLNKMVNNPFYLKKPARFFRPKSKKENDSTIQNSLKNDIFFF